MILRCPQCRTESRHERGDVLGQRVICPVCERPFAWREATPVGGPRRGESAGEETPIINPRRSD